MNARPCRIRHLKVAFRLSQPRLSLSRRGANSLWDSARPLYPSHVSSAIEVRPAPALERVTGSTHRVFGTGTDADLPRFLVRFLRSGDSLAFLSEGHAEILIERRAKGTGPTQLLYATIGYASLPKADQDGSGFFVRADLPNRSTGPKSLFLPGTDIRRYFYLLDGDANRQTLYDLLQVSNSASLADLRLAWRVRSLELGASPAHAAERAKLERAFNILAHPDLRNCYDVLRRDEDAPPLFPYGGFGSILVEGELSEDGQAFFGHCILAYKPEMSSRRVSLLLRSCEFFADRVICRDPRRKLEVWLDANLLPGVPWDLTWNEWKHWLTTRLEVQATFVYAGKYRLKKGEWILRTWHAALPSRLRVTVPACLAADVERAKAIHRLLGEHAAVVEKVRAEVEKRPIEYMVAQDWFDRLGVSPHLKPQHITWRPDYEPYYFEQLRTRSRTWFLFRDEYLFVWRNVLISEMPQPGHATYLFAQTEDIAGFMIQYSQATRDDIRQNRNNLATALGFVGRVIRGTRKKRWLADVLRRAGEKADYVEAFE